MIHGSSATGLLATLLVSSISLGAPGPPADDSRGYRIALGHHPELVVRNALGSFEIRAARGRVTVLADGVRLPETRLARSGRIVRVLDAAGETILMFGFFTDRGPGDQIVYCPDLDPSTIEANAGLAAEPLDETMMTDRERSLSRELVGRSGLDPRLTLVITRIVPGGAADRAGIRAGDFVTRVGGLTPRDASLLHERAAARAADATLVLGVLQDGREREVRLALDAPPQWPEAERLEALFRAL